MPNLILHANGAATLTGKHPSTGDHLVLPVKNIRPLQTVQTRGGVGHWPEVLSVTFADIKRVFTDPPTMIQCQLPDGGLMTHEVVDDLILQLKGDLFTLAKAFDVEVPSRPERQTA